MRKRIKVCKYEYKYYCDICGEELKHGFISDDNIDYCDECFRKKNREKENNS